MADEPALTSVERAYSVESGEDGALTLVDCVVTVSAAEPLNILSELCFVVADAATREQLATTTLTVSDATLTYGGAEHIGTMEHSAGARVS